MVDKLTQLNQEEQSLNESLHALLTNFEANKRDSGIEKTQLEIIKIALMKLAIKYEDNVVFDFEGWNTKKKDNRWFITREGEIKLLSSGFNRFYDCKTFDAVLNATISGKPFTFYFILKGVENDGGHQRNVEQELGKYSECIQRNTDENSHFFFVLDGTYINKHIEDLDVCDKYDVTTSDRVKEVVENFIVSVMSNVIEEMIDLNIHKKYGCETQEVNS